MVALWGQKNRREKQCSSCTQCSVVIFYLVICCKILDWIICVGMSFIAASENNYTPFVVFCYAKGLSDTFNTDQESDDLP